MEPTKLKDLVVGGIERTFQAWAEIATRAGGGSGKAVPAIQGMQTAILEAVKNIDARIYPDDEFSSKVALTGADLAYRSAIVSDASRDDEWIAALSIGFEQLDDHTRKVLLSHVDPQIADGVLAGSQARRLLISVICAKRTISVDPFFTVIVVTPADKLALVPAPVAWAVPQPAGPHLIINHMEVESYQERLDIASRRLSIIEAATAASLMDDHVRGAPSGTMH